MPRKSTEPNPPAFSLNFSALVDSIRQVHQHCSTQARHAVNVSLTLRNWLIGYYIREYEQNGADRAKYGKDLLDRLSGRLQADGTLEYHPRELRRCREFYCTYPQIWGTPSPKFDHLLPASLRKSLPAKVDGTPPSAAVGSISPQLLGSPRRPKSAIAKSGQDTPVTIWGTLSPELAVPAERLVTTLSYSHFVELIPIEDPLKRAFYEIECVRGNWSVRALKRQIASLYFERSGLSTDKDKLAALAHAAAEQAEPKLAIRDPYIFEFLGLKAKEAVAESDLEDALLDNLQEFLLELGHGFCLEARQKSIVIGNTRGFVDLVFYHRVLKCHVLVDLKVDEFRHEHIGQLNTYVTWYNKHMMVEGDNPPVGLLLCTQKDHSLAEYALAAINNRLFVSKYQLELPSKEDLQRFLEEKRREVGDDT